MSFNTFDASKGVQRPGLANPALPIWPDPSRPSDRPTGAEQKATAEAVARYQAVFDTH